MVDAQFKLLKTIQCTQSCAESKGDMNIHVCVCVCVCVYKIDYLYVYICTYCIKTLVEYVTTDENLYIYIYIYIYMHA